MRLNRYIAAATELSRRAADDAIAAGRVRVNGTAAGVGTEVGESDTVELDGEQLIVQRHQYIMLHKPVGYVCSRRQQGNTPTIYELLPAELAHLNPVGRLDKNSSGLLLLTNDGEFANQLTHPSHQKDKHYEVTLDHALTDSDKASLEAGVELTDGASQLQLSGQHKWWKVIIHEGRNRQIRRSFDALGYTVIKLHRTSFGPYQLGALVVGKYETTEPIA